MMLEGEDGDFKKENNLPIQEKMGQRIKQTETVLQKKWELLGCLTIKNSE